MPPELPIRLGGFKVQVTSFVLHVYHKDDMAAKTGRVEDVEKVQVDGLVSIRWFGMLYAHV